MNVTWVLAPNVTVQYGYYQNYDEGYVLLVNSNAYFDSYVYYLDNVKTQLSVTYNTTNQACDWNCLNSTCCDRSRSRTAVDKIIDEPEDELTQLKKSIHSKFVASSAPEPSKDFDCYCDGSSKIYPFWALYEQTTYDGNSYQRFIISAL